MELFENLAEVRLFDAHCSPDELQIMNFFVAILQCTARLSSLCNCAMQTDVGCIDET